MQLSGEGSDSGERSDHHHHHHQQWILPPSTKPTTPPTAGPQIATIAIYPADTSTPVLLKQSYYFRGNGCITKGRTKRVTGRGSGRREGTTAAQLLSGKRSVTGGGEWQSYQ